MRLFKIIFCLPALIFIVLISLPFFFKNVLSSRDSASIVEEIHDRWSKHYWSVASIFWLFVIYFLL